MTLENLCAPPVRCIVWFGVLTGRDGQPYTNYRFPQTGLGVLAMASLLAMGGWRSMLPALLLVAGGCWYLTFAVSEPDPFTQRATVRKAVAPDARARRRLR